MVYFVITLFGLLFGSFLNVCIVRLPRKQSILLPRSHCPLCKHTIRWYDNIPLVSYVLLRGRCRDCHARISPQYAMVEALTAILLVATFRRFGLSPEFVKYSALVMLLIVVIFTDLRERRIPHAVTFFGIGLGVVLSLFIAGRQPSTGMAGGANGRASSRNGVIGPGRSRRSTYRRRVVLRCRDGLFHLGWTDEGIPGVWRRDADAHGGDFLGAPLTLLTILLGSFAGSIVALSVTLAAPRFRNYPWPYGTFLGIAAVYAALDGQRLLEAYFRWSGMAG